MKKKRDLYRPLNGTRYTCPPAATIARELGVAIEVAQTLRKLAKGEVRVTRNPAFPETNKWILACYHAPNRIERILEAMGEVYGCYSVRAIRTEDDQFNAVVEYLDNGSTYATTLIFRHDTGTFRLGDIGGFRERNEKRLHLQDF